ncbi:MULTISPECIES: hypothetical protein [unclassified Arthrobacter]|uniref:hypothetical protein n=1 Tax=unclassified Arthrobacter TaxID=235627 RepID=UPI001D15D193|nr:MULTISPECIES: hypothetical protein [unclassified Arthrobacter]MCC3276833.1 hypothetical protein [Arthrobacter sp. zg-Y20]MCC9176139.1 hypothetical protein [Arthrobacter sp. zg-Y750]MDK1316994.1 hypothetical protein [Arthrobacter sp. zg.Y20]WIB05292.1 hypothetical protein QNO06_12220 [Arthrobacter sp. zg-Y20]
MRWDALFRDMEAQMAASAALEAEDEIAERVRIEVQGVSLQDRLRSQSGKHLVFDLGLAGRAEGTLRQTGTGWAVLEQQRGGQVLVVLSHVAWIRGMDRYAALQAGAVHLGLGSALRGIARDRSTVTVRCAGTAAETALHGTIDRVGGDFLELAAVPGGGARRSSNVTGMYVLPTASVAAVLSRDSGWE